MAALLRHLCFPVFHSHIRTAAFYSYPFKSVLAFLWKTFFFSFPLEKLIFYSILSHSPGRTRLPSWSIPPRGSYINSNDLFKSVFHNGVELPSLMRLGELSGLSGQERLLMSVAQKLPSFSGSSLSVKNFLGDFKTILIMDWGVWSRECHSTYKEMAAATP